MASENHIVKELQIPIAIQAQMERQVAKEAPLEACGMLGGTRSGNVLQAKWIYPTRNELTSPVQYMIDPVDQLQAFNDMEKKGLELVAIYHSHPAGPAYPSEIDINRAYYPEAVQLIWSSGKKLNSGKTKVTSRWICRGFIIDENQIREVDLLISE